AVELDRVLSDQRFNQSIELVLFRNQLIDRPVSFLLNLHRTTQALTGTALRIEETLKVARAISSLHLSPSRIDVGKLALKIREQGIADTEITAFVGGELAGAKDHNSFVPRDVVLYGFGRIGRLLARELISKSGAGRQLRLRAIVTRDKVDAATLEKRAALLRQDSIHC